MAKSCATLAQFLDLTLGEFSTVGAVSRAVLDVAVNPTPGAVLTITDPNAVPVVVATLTAVGGAPAANEFQVGVDAAATAVNIAAALNLATNTAGTLVQAAASGTDVFVNSIATGPLSLYTLASSTTDLVWDLAALDGGADVVTSFLDATCSMINLECWGNKASTGHIYLAAHQLTGFLDDERGPANAVSIDKISESYAAVGTATKLDANFATTRWGRLYLQVRSTLAIFPTVARQIIPMVGRS
jgi:hypothetical protein